MTSIELIFTAVIFAFAVYYIYRSLFKKDSCGGSCGCGSKAQTKKPKKEKENNAQCCGS